MSAGLLMLGVVVAYLTNRPKHSEEKVPVMAKGDGCRRGQRVARA